MTISNPRWLRLMLFAFSSKYRREWVSLVQRSHVTGTAREEKVIWTGFGYRLVVSRESKKRQK